MKNTDKPARRDFYVAIPEKLGDDGFDDRLVFSDEATSPNLTTRDFFGGIAKRLIYVPPLSKNEDAMKIRITEAVATIDNAMQTTLGYPPVAVRLVGGGPTSH